MEITKARQIVTDVKQHLFMTEHLVQQTPGVFAQARFTPFEHIMEWWNNAAKPTGASFDPNLIYLLAHEYIEAKLMQAGMPYRGMSVVGNEINQVLPFNYGAHDLSPIDASNEIHFKAWQTYLNRNTNLNLDPNLSNLDNLVNTIKEIEGL